VHARGRGEGITNNRYLHLMRTTPLCSSSISRRRMLLAMIYSRDSLSFSLTSSLVARSHCIANSTCSANTITLPPANSSGRAPAPAPAPARARARKYHAAHPRYTRVYGSILRGIKNHIGHVRTRPAAAYDDEEDAP